MKYMTQNLSHLCSIVDGTLQLVTGHVYLQKVNNFTSDHWAKITISSRQIQRGAFIGNLCMLPYNCIMSCIWIYRRFLLHTHRDWNNTPVYI